MEDNKIFIPNTGTRFFVLYGDPLQYSVSPWMHNHVFRELGLNCFYYPLEYRDEGMLAGSIQKMSLNRIFGANVTMPYKSVAALYMDELADSALHTGAVNTIVITENGRKVGHNTDGIGFVTAMTSVLSVNPTGGRFLIIGAGGAATAITFALAARGAKRIRVLCRREDKNLADTLREKTERYHSGVCEFDNLNEENISNCLLESDVIINATKVGMYPEPKGIILNPDLLEKRHIVCDVVYNPRETGLLLEAAKRGCKTMGGLWMMVFQGAAACGLWTGITPPTDFMYKKACEFFAK